MFIKCVFVLFVWITARAKIVKDHREDVERNEIIESHLDSVTNRNLVVKEKIFDKELTSVSFANEEEISEVSKKNFCYNIILNNKKRYDSNVHEEIKTDARF